MQGDSGSARTRAETLQLRREMYFQRRNDRPGRKTKTEPEKARDADIPELEISSSFAPSVSSGSG